MFTNFSVTPYNQGVTENNSNPAGIFFYKDGEIVEGYANPKQDSRKIGRTATETGSQQIDPTVLRTRRLFAAMDALMLASLESNLSSD